MPKKNRKTATKTKRHYTPQEVMALWRREVVRARYAQRTFSQARMLFHQRHGFWPPWGIPYTPKYRLDWHRLVKHVDERDLVAPIPLQSAYDGGKERHEEPGLENVGGS